MERFAKFGAVVLLMGGLAWLASGPSTVIAGEEHGFEGAATCKMCHSSDSKGAQYKVWAAGPHAKAFKTLQSDKAKEVAKAAGVAGAPEEADQCLKCHVTAHGVKPELLGKKYSKEEGVGCESCHGAGKDYKMIHGKDAAAAVAKGLVKPDEALCVTCHNEESPTYKEFNFEERVKQIAHPRP